MCFIFIDRSTCVLFLHRLEQHQLNSFVCIHSQSISGFECCITFPTRNHLWLIKFSSGSTPCASSSLTSSSCISWSWTTSKYPVLSISPFSRVTKSSLDTSPITKTKIFQIPLQYQPESILLFQTSHQKHCHAPIVYLYSNFLLHLLGKKIVF